MIRVSLSALVPIALAFGVSVLPAEAQQARSFVSNALGNDGNAPNCLRNAPCRTFQVAHDNTLNFGEITILDPGSYGAVVINRPISIINDGVGEAGVLVSGGNVGITVDAGGTDSVTLRGLTIKGIGFGGGGGVVFNSGSFLSIENCVVRNMTGPSFGVIGSGIVFQPQPAGGASSLSVTDTVVTDNQFNGIWVHPIGNGFVHSVFNRVTSNHNGLDGFSIDDTQFSGPIWAAVDNSVAAQNGDAAFEAAAALQQGPVLMTVVRSVAEGNTSAFSAGASAVVSVSESLVTGNLHTWQGQTVASYGDNIVKNNSDGDPAAFTSAGPKR